MRTIVATVACLALAVGGCGCKHGRSVRARVKPTITFEPTAYTYDRENPNHAVHLKVTLHNPSEERLAAHWDALKATADGPMIGPTPHGSDLRPELEPDETMTAAVSFAYVGGEHARPTSLTVTYSPAGRAIVRRQVPVTIIPTSGFGFRLSLPARAELVANPYPLRGEAWEVRVPIEIRNPTKGPLMLVPFWFEARFDDQRAIHAGNVPSQLNAVMRLDPGEQVKGALLWRFRGTGPQPRRVMVSFPSAVKPDFIETIDVKGSEP